MSRKSRASAESKPELGFGTSLGTSDLSVDDLRTTIHKAAGGEIDSSAVIAERLAPKAWPIAYCFSEKPDEVFKMVSEGVVAAAASTSEGKGEYDPSLQLIRTTLGSSTSVKEMKAAPNRNRRRTKAADALVNTATDPVSAAAFGALSSQQRFLLWTLMVGNLAPSTIARLTEMPTKKVQDGLRRSAYLFRRHYVNRVDRRAMSAACSAAFDEFPDFLSRRLPKNAEVELSAHIEKCATCGPMVTKLRALEGRLLDAIPPYPSALTKTTYAALITRYPAPKNELDLVAEQMEPVEGEDLEPETPVRVADARTWWLRDSRKPAFIIGTTAAAATFVISAVFATPSPTTATIANNSPETTTSTTVLATTSTGLETTTTLPAVLAPTTTSTVRATTTTTSVVATPTVKTTTVLTAPRVTTTVPAAIVDLPGASTTTTTAPPPTTTSTTVITTTTTAVVAK